MKLKIPAIPENISAAEKSTWTIGSPVGCDRKFRHHRLSHLPPRISNAIAKKYRKLYSKAGLQTANLYLLRISEYLTFTTVNLALSDESLKLHGKSMVTKAFSFKQLISDELALYDVLCKMANKSLIPPPIVSETISLSGAINRFRDEQWWIRKARSIHKYRFEVGMISAGLVHKHSAKYISDETYKRHQEQKDRNRRVLDLLIATNDIDENEYSLSDLISHSQANPKNRRYELMVRIAGSDQIAKDLNHDGVFITLTCPSRMHPIYAKSGDINPLYDGTDPKQAQYYLTSLWKRIRAKLKRDLIHIYGIRVAEPQHDGTPHWHLLIFSDPKNTTKIKAICSHYALQDSPNEKGAQKHRITFDMIDRNKGSAVGYIAKYISKNIDAEHIDKDLDGHDAKSSALRVEAWASTFGIRQFQMFGCPPVTIWRELRRLNGAPEGVLQQAYSAADSGNWALFIEALGGIEQDKKNLPIKVLKLWSDEEGKYGDPKGESIQGITDGIQDAISRDKIWTISRKENNVTDSVRMEGRSPPS
ncbi:MAG: replication protein A [Methylophaga sp.]|nr:MAG: replication protein A [Methylophaga sp.]